MSYVPPAYVYVIGEPGSGLVKIGRSNAPNRRLTEIRCAAKMRSAVVLWSIDVSDKAQAHGVEQLAHSLLRSRRVHRRREWFRVTPELAQQAIERAIHLGVPGNLPQYGEPIS